MAKLRLNVDELAVESFVPAEGREGRGTVEGHSVQITIGENCVGVTAPPRCTESGRLDCIPIVTAYGCTLYCPSTDCDLSDLLC